LTLLNNFKFFMIMLKTKNILIIVILIVAIGMEFSVILFYQRAYFFPKTETPELTPIEIKELPKAEYEIASVGTWQDKIKWARYHIITEKPLAEEEQIKILAEKIIKDIAPENLKLDKVELLFYHDKSVACQVDEAKARAIWTPDGLSTEILEKKK